MSKVFVIMGVSGSGKTTVGLALAEKLGVPFYDGDDFHPPQNVAKMASGVPLTDDDRYPWLACLHDLIADYLARNETAVITCSALKKNYRDQLRNGNDGLIMVYLKGDFDLIWERMEARRAHYMKSDMLQSQFQDLEPPSPRNALIVSVEYAPDYIASYIVENSDVIQS